MKQIQEIKEQGQNQQPTSRLPKSTVRDQFEKLIKSTVVQEYSFVRNEYPHGFGLITPVERTRSMIGRNSFSAGIDRDTLDLSRFSVAKDMVNGQASDRSLLVPFSTEPANTALHQFLGLHVAPRQQVQPNVHISKSPQKQIETKI